MDETNDLLGLMKWYLQETSPGGWTDFQINMNHHRQRFGQAFFNSLNRRDQELLRGSTVDPFSEGGRLRQALEFLVDNS